MSCFHRFTQRPLVPALAFSLLCFASLDVKAQVSTTVRPGGGMVTSTSAPRTAAPLPAVAEPAGEPLAAGASVIYSNLGTGSSIYNSGTGWTESGADSGIETQAMSFTPANNYVLLRIDAAFTYVTGTNRITMILAADNNGVPGKTIFATSFSNLPTFGTCCVLQTVTLTPTATQHVALQAGQRYWLYPLPADASTYAVWNFDTTGKGGTGAVSQDYGKTWSAIPYDPLGAFAVYGKQLGS